MWFKTATPESVLPVFTTKVEPGDEQLFAAVSEGMPAEYAARAARARRPSSKR